MVHIIINESGLFDRDKNELIAKFKNIKKLLIGKVSDNILKNPWAELKPHEMFFSICRSRKYKGDKYYDFAVKDRKRRKAITHQILEGMAAVGLVPKELGVFVIKKEIKKIDKNSRNRTMTIQFKRGTYDEQEEQQEYVENQRSTYLAGKLLSTMEKMEQQRTSFEREIEEVRRQSAMIQTASFVVPAQLTDLEDVIDADELNQSEELLAMRASLDEERGKNVVMQGRISILESQLQSV